MVYEIAQNASYIQSVFHERILVFTDLHEIILILIPSRHSVITILREQRGDASKGKRIVWMKEQEDRLDPSVRI
jgi:hypothetical protein